MARDNAGLMLGAAVVLGGLWLLSTRKAAAAGAAPSPATPFSPTPFVVPNIAPPTPVPGVIAPTGSQVTATQAIWSNLTPSTGPSSGYVNFPAGSQAAAVFLPWAYDSAGNYYTQWAGQIYLVNVAQPDMMGNYAARLLGS
jgi:hypothetical protein